MDAWEIGVCSWSIDRSDVLRSIDAAAGRFGLRVVQTGFLNEEAVRSADPAAITAAARAAGVTLLSPFVAFDQEDYSSIERIAATGGYAPSEHYPARLAITRAIAELATATGCRAVAVHACTVSPDAAAPQYMQLVERVREVADLLACHNLQLLLETGRESADALAGFINAVERENVGINFDPGNFIVYGTDEPARAVAKLTGLIENVHMKDAIRSALPGVEFGRPAILGAGDADIPRVLDELRATGYAGPLMIEANTRLFGAQAIADAAEYLRSMLK